MPCFAPRLEPVKKREQLQKFKRELEHAVKKDLPIEKQIRLVDKYRLAQLSLLKAKMHEAKEGNFERKNNTLVIGKIENQASLWKAKSFELILKEVKQETKG